MTKKCKSCGKESGEYDYCFSCNNKYKEQQNKQGTIDQIKNLNQNIGHFVALYAKVHPKEEQEVLAEWKQKEKQREEQEK
ncbi:hypothetical protein LCGC14_1448590 [marine sediment metagenome]|uniref:Uncharacterized protein n=1 Tax=marine sediment metagenome TaxID=412755 RepID=A0A0F9JJ84_9ZZZZ